MVVLILRVVHVLLGVFWAGAIFMIALFLQPAIAASGPEGGKVMVALVRRRMLDLVPLAALATILSGVWLLWSDSSGFQREWMGSRIGMALSSGGLLAFVGFLIGVFVMRASTLKALAVGQSAAQLADAAARETAMGRFQALRRRAALAARTVAVLLAAAVVAMAVARNI